jgi:hypothetical protein
MPFSIDSVAVNVPSYPAIAVEANPANSIKMRSRSRDGRDYFAIHFANGEGPLGSGHQRRVTPDHVPGAIRRMRTAAAISRQ